MRLDRRHAVRKLCASLGCVALALIVASCGVLTGTDSERQIFALATINGAPVGPSRNLLAECAPEMAAEGAELQALGDTLVLLPGGHGEWRTHQRSRAADYQQLTIDSVRVSFYDAVWEFRYVAEGRDIKFTAEAWRGEFHRLRGGGLEYDGFCGRWHFEPVSATAP